MPERLRFYLDEMVPPAVASGLRRREVNVLTTQEAGQVGASDDEQLAFANRKSRTVFTMDEDFLEMAVTETRCGIVFLAQRRFSVGRAVHGLYRLWETRTPDSIRGLVEFL